MMRAESEIESLAWFIHGALKAIAKIVSVGSHDVAPGAQTIDIDAAIGAEMLLGTVLVAQENLAVAISFYGRKLEVDLGNPRTLEDQSKRLVHALQAASKVRQVAGAAGE